MSTSTSTSTSTSKAAEVTKKVNELIRAVSDSKREGMLGRTQPPPTTGRTARTIRYPKIEACSRCVAKKSCDCYRRRDSSKNGYISENCRSRCGKCERCNQYDIEVEVRKTNVEVDADIQAQLQGQLGVNVNAPEQTVNVTVTPTITITPTITSTGTATATGTGTGGGGGGVTPPPDALPIVGLDTAAFSFTFLPLATAPAFSSAAASSSTVASRKAEIKVSKVMAPPPSPPAGGSFVAVFSPTAPPTLYPYPPLPGPPSTTITTTTIAGAATAVVLSEPGTYQLLVRENVAFGTATAVPPPFPTVLPTTADLLLASLVGTAVAPVIVLRPTISTTLAGPQVNLPYFLGGGEFRRAYTPIAGAVEPPLALIAVPATVVAEFTVLAGGAVLRLFLDIVTPGTGLALDPAPLTSGIAGDPPTFGTLDNPAAAPIFAVTRLDPADVSAPPPSAVAAVAAVIPAISI